MIVKKGLSLITLSLVFQATTALFAQNSIQESEPPRHMTREGRAKEKMNAGTESEVWMPANNSLSGSPVTGLIIRRGDLFASNFAAGVFVSTDQGSHWIHKSKGLYSRLVNCMGVGRTGDLFVGGSGIYRSRDAGENWAQVASEFINGTVWSLTINISGHLFAGTTSRGVIKSTDGGSTWFVANNGLNDTTITAILAVGESDVWAAGGGFWEHLYHSSNGGETWNAMDSAGISLIMTIAVNPKGSLFVGTTHGVYRSTDNGVTWVFPDSALADTWIHSIAFDSTNRIYLGTGGHVYHSTDNGDSWTPSDSGFVGSSGRGIYSMAVDDHGRIFAGSYNSGVYCSTDDGIRWNLSENAMFESYVQAMAVDRHDRIVVGTYKGRLFRTSSYGDDWNLLNRWTDGGISALLVDDADFIFAGVSNSDGGAKLYRSTDDGSTFHAIAPYLITNYVPDLATLGGGIIFAGQFANGISRSIDHGNTWVQSGLQGLNISSIAANSRGRLFAGTFNGRMFCSADTGATWVDISPETTITNVGFTDIRVTIEDEIYAALWGRGIFKSQNDGLTWEMVNQGLSNLEIYSVFSDNVGNIYSGSFFYNVFRSTNRGQTWHRFDRGMPLRGTHVLAIASSGQLFAGSHDYGVYRSIGTLMSEVESFGGYPRSFSVSQNYPNPFNPSTTIRFAVPKSGFVELRIYNTLGQEVVALVNEEKGAGTYSAQWNAGSLASGVYFYRLKMGEYSETKKLLLLK